LKEKTRNIDTGNTRKEIKEESNLGEDDEESNFGEGGKIGKEEGTEM
jgi:hypothetical protein